MTDAEARAVADASDMIINGYAYTRRGDGVSVFNLRTGKATVFTANREVSETSMDDMDLTLARRYLVQNERFLEHVDA